MSSPLTRLRPGRSALIAVSQLASIASLGVLLLARRWSTPWLLDVALIVCLALFSAAATEIAAALRGPRRLVFAAFSLLSAAACVGMVLLLGSRAVSLDSLLARLSDLELASVLAAMNALLAVYGDHALRAERHAAEALARRVTAERQLTATLEQAVASRTVQLEDAQRVLQRMWWLGQQITLELNPHRVLERFLEAVVDIVQAAGGCVGLVGSEDNRIRIVAAAGQGAEGFLGRQVPVTGSVIGRVVRTGQAWVGSEATEPGEDIDGMAGLGGVAIAPITRRGDRIGAVMVGGPGARVFTPQELERITAMTDLLSVALENAELVETIRQAEWRFRTLFRAAPDAVFTVLQSGRIREANDAVREVTGCDPLQVVGRVVTELVTECDRAALQSALDAAFAGRPARLEVTMEYQAPDWRAETPRDAARGHHPRRRVVALAASRLPEADPPSVLVVGRDMTAEREMRGQLMEADRLAAVGELVAGVAHEVNNPLSSISAFAQLLLRDGGLTPTQRESIEVIKSETQRASQVVKDLLAFARRSEPQREPLDINAIVARTLRLKGYQLGTSRITLSQSLSAELPAVIGDTRQIQQVLFNLVTNAIQAMAPLGGGSLAVRTYVESRAPGLEGGERVVLEVRDSGPGIPASVRDHIFEPFFTTKREGEGTGLGLSVSYGIVAAHGGRIEVESPESGGATFRVDLPAASAPAIDASAPEGVPLARRSPLAGIRLLFVDDEPALRHGIEAFGRMRGFAVVTASDGTAALDLVRSTGIDAVVCDLRMPGMDGAAFFERLRAERPGLATRTVFITGDVIGASGKLSGSSASAGAGALGRQPVVTKPFAFERLEEALVSVVRGPAYVSSGS